MTRATLLTLLITLPVLALAPVARPSPLDALVPVLAATEDVEVQRDLLRGMSDALAGRRRVTAPRGWSEVHRKLIASQDAAVREGVLALSVLFGDPQALIALRRAVEDRRAGPAERERALAVLLDRGEGDLRGLLQTLLDDDNLRGAAIRGMARFGDPKTPERLLGRYAALGEAEKADVVATLASRPTYALALIDALEKKQLPRAAVTAFQARQILALKDARVTARLNSVWGTIRAPGKDREALLARYRALAGRKEADRSQGRAVFAKTCAACHTLFGEGGKIGPDLTGSQRANADYVLGKVLDPNAVVPRDYQVTRLVTVTGRVLTGLVKQENDKGLLLQTPTEELRVLKDDIEARERINLSLMPEGQLQALTDREIRDLLAYLAGHEQAPLPNKVP